MAKTFLKQIGRSTGIVLTLLIAGSCVQSQCLFAQERERPQPFALREGSPKHIAKSWSIDDGLPLNVVWTIEQTDDGMLWIGTLDGLARFDGHSFTTYTAATTDGLAGNRVVGLHEEKAGALWIGTETGVSVYRDGSFRRVEGISGHIENFGEGPGGTLWMSGHAGIYRAVAQDGEVARIRLPDSLRGAGATASGGDVPESRVVAVTGEESGWIGLGERLWRYDEGAFRRVRRLNGMIETPIRRLAAVSDRLAIATESALISVTNGTPDRYSHEGGPVGEMALLPSGEVWMTTFRSGLLRLSEGRLDDRLRGLTRDRHGQWWVGDQDEGLVRLQPRLFWPVDGGLSGDPGARGVYAGDSGAVWAGVGDRGVFRFTDSTRANWTENEGVVGKFVRSIAEDASGVLHVGTREGLSRRSSGRRFERVQSPDKETFHTVTALQRDETGTLWVGADSRLYRRRSGTFERVFPEESPISSRIMGLRRAEDGALWIGTREDGAIRRTEDGDVETYDTDDGVPYKSVRDIYETDDETIWISTSGGGIARFEGDHFTAVTPADGLPHRSIHLIREAPKGTFWMTSNGGVFRASRSQVEEVADGTRDQMHAQTFGRPDGMPARECNGPIHPAFAKAPSGYLWIPTVNGLAVINSGSHQLDVPDSIPMRVTELRAGGTPRPLDSLRLEPSTYRVGIDFTGITLRHADDLFFRYRLDGKAWTPALGRRTAEFTSLEAGAHEFEVQATINGETWYELKAPLRFTVAPYFYQTWWFRLLLGLGLVGLGIGAYRWRVRRMQRRQEKLEAAVEERTQELAEEKEKTKAQAERLAELDEAKNRFLAHVSHEFRTPLSLILTPLRDALERASGGGATLGESQLRRMAQNAGRLHRLIEQLLDLATLETGQMRLDCQPGDLARIAGRAAEAFRSKAEREEIDLRVETPEGQVPARFDPEKVETIVSNLVGNAVKYTPEGGRVAVRISTAETEAAEMEASDVETGQMEAPESGEAAERVACIEVADTGPGIESAFQPRIFDRFERAPEATESGQDDGTLRQAGQEGMGLGLALTRELVELHGGRIEVDSVPGEGATFTVWLPLVPVVGGAVRSAEGEPPAEPGTRELEAEMPEGGGPETGLPEEGKPGNGKPGGEKFENGSRGSTAEEAEAPTTEKSGATTAEPGEEDASRESTILVVEDNAEMRAYLREQLGRKWNVLTAADGEEAWTQVQEDAPDLVLSDVMMPGTGGVELCRRVKEELPTTPVILLTARASDEDQVKGLQAGADDYIAKPFDISGLRQRIENHLAARRRMREQQQREVRLAGIGETIEEEEVPFVENVLAVVEENLSNPDFTTDWLAEEAALSRRQLTRRLKDAVGKTPAALVRRCRIERAKALFRGQAETVAEVAYAVGFRSPSHFTQVFQKETGRKPSAYRKENGSDGAARRQ